MPLRPTGCTFGTFARFAELQSYLDGFANLYLVGRNGMHRYNNQDHSMLSARFAAEAVVKGSADKSAIWAVNVDDDYHEEGASRAVEEGASPSMRGQPSR